MAMFDFSGLADQVQKSVPKQYLSFTYHEIELILEALNCIRDQYDTDYKNTDYSDNVIEEEYILQIIEDLTNIHHKFETYEFH